MADRGPDQDRIALAPREDEEDETYKDASYLGTSENDDEDVRDLGFIVDDHDDRRAAITDGWQRLDDLDTDEPLETNRKGSIPHATALRERGAAPERFATDYNVSHAHAERQEEDFIETSLLNPDPDMNDGVEDFTDETFENVDGAQVTTDILGRVAGVGDGAGTAIPQDIARGGFEIRDNPLATDEGDFEAIAGREAGVELSDYDDAQQDAPRERLDSGAEPRV